MKLRDYQADAIDRILQQFDTAKSTLAVLATGLGKSVIFAEVAARWSDRGVLLLSHRKELVEQGLGHLKAVCGPSVMVEMADCRDGGEWSSRLDKPIVSASVQTLSSPKRLAKFKPDDFGLLVIDEAHHAPSRSYRNVIEHFSKAKLLGVTATPKRGDDVALGKVFDTVAFEMDIRAGIDAGWLVPVKALRIRVEGLDFSHLKTRCGDFQEGELERILTEEKPLHEMARVILEETRGPSLVFCAGVKHSELLAAMLCRYSPESAAHVDGTTAADRRDSIVGRYKAGNLRFLLSCGVFTEGFDAPITQNVVMGRPTQSVGLYMQILGRGTRSLPGTVDGIESAAERRLAIRTSAKPGCVVLDFVGNTSTHQNIVTAEDILGGEGRLPAKVIAYAKQVAEQAHQPIDVDELTALAEREIRMLELLNRKRGQIKAASASYRREEADIFGRPLASYLPAHEKQNAAGDISDKQANYIRFLAKRLGKRAPEDLWTWSKRRAGRLISDWAEQLEAQTP